MPSQAHHIVRKVCLRPQAQVRALLDWLHSAGVEHFDLHVRAPLGVNTQGTSARGQRWITCHENLSASQVLELEAWWRHMNAQGADVYFRPHRFDSHPLVFLDDVNPEMAERIAKKYSCAVIQTSPGSHHVWLKVDRKLNRNARYLVQSNLSHLGVCDPGSVSGDHLGRMCGLRSYKNHCWVNASIFSTPRPYQPPLKSIIRGAGRGAVCPNRPTRHGRESPSERDFTMALRRLKHGVERKQIEAELQASALHRGKRDPRGYALRTLNKAIKVSRHVP